MKLFANILNEDKEQQFELINSNNPFNPDLGNHTWIKSCDDIKTYEEVWSEEGELYDATPDFTKQDAQHALESGKIKVYSSYPITQGIFVTPSKMEAQNYAGNGKIYAKTVNLNDVAWIDNLQGQYANINESKKIITINESQIMTLLFEAATIQDIYQKYYSQIPQETYIQIITSDPTYSTEKPNKMGKFGKWLLSIYQKGNLKTEDLYKAKQYLSTFIRFNTKIEQKDIMKYKSLQELFNVVEPFINNPQQTATKAEEIRKIKEGAEKVYEDSKWMVIVPHTQEASCYYGKNTQWCTAAEHSDNMFENYNSKGLLYINILKGTDTKFQFHFETSSYMDARDEEIIHPVAKTIGLTPGLVDFYLSKYGKTAAIDLTTKYDTNELEEMDGLNGYYYIDDEMVCTYDEEQKRFVKVFELPSDYHYIDGKVINQRFIIIDSEDYYVNLYDIEKDEYVFNDTDGVQYFEYYNSNGGFLRYIQTIFDDDTRGLFDLKTLTFTSTDLPSDLSVGNQLNKSNFDTFKYYNEDLAISWIEDGLGNRTAFAPFSLSKGRSLTAFKYTNTKRETLYYKGQPYLFRCFIPKNGDDYHDADLLFYDGTIVPLPKFCQESDRYMQNFFGNQK